MTVTGPCTSAGDDKVLLNVEVQLRPDSRADLGAVRAAALAYLASLPSVRYAEGPLCPPPGQHPLLDAHVQGLAVVDLGGSVPPGKLLLQWDVAFNVSAACACWPTAAAAPATEPHTSMVGAAQRAPLPPLHPSNRSWCSSWTARGLRTTTRARRARLRTASGCCPPQTFMGHGRRWWVPGALQGGRLSRNDAAGRPMGEAGAVGRAAATKAARRGAVAARLPHAAYTFPPSSLHSSLSTTRARSRRACCDTPRRRCCLRSGASTRSSSRGTGWCCCTARPAPARPRCARRWRRSWPSGWATSACWWLGGGAGSLVGQGWRASDALPPGTCCGGWPKPRRRRRPPRHTALPAAAAPRRYPQGGVLIEVNAHSLFSKWFSESGKLVSRLFAKIQARAGADSHARRRAWPGQPASSAVVAARAAARTLVGRSPRSLPCPAPAFPLSCQLSTAPSHAGSGGRA